MRPADLYHVGIVVDDFDATLERLSEVSGYRWADEFRGEQTVETPDGELKVPLHFAYSMDEPRLEIVESVPGTVWEPSTSGVHHLGYWSEDVDRDVTTLVNSGMEVEVKAPNPDGTALWAYCKGSRGPRIELVSSTMRDILLEWFTTGRSPLA